MDTVTAENYPLNSEQFAAQNQVKAQTVRSRICRTKTYFGVIPVKMANGLLAFPDVLVGSAEHHAQAAADRVVLKAKLDAAADRDQNSGVAAS